MERRHQHVFLAQFQRWFIWSFVLYSAAFLTLMSIGLILWYQVSAHEFMNLSGLLSATFHTKLETSLHQGIALLVVMNVLLLGVATFQAVWFSKKIAGPVYALYLHLDRVAESGKWTPFKLRDGDLFSELPQKLDRAYEQTQQHERQVS